ncbi:YL1 nuclear protein [Colletotrichum tofieldiae]|nr:YL1 nuclear protein [Colletotrichum tofieldiae]
MAATANELKPASHDESSDSGSGSDSENDTPTTSTPTTVEWLATGRSKRSTAGNRMKSMLANEEPDSDLELLFAEDDNDEGFTDVDDAGSDVQMDSSSDDEDEQNHGDDFEGEKELEKQARDKKLASRKRKAQDAIPAKFRKKVRIDQATAPAPRPKKKSERTSWLPSPGDMPIRASLRQTTMLSKEQLHHQMKEREAKRLKQLAVMEKKAKKLEAMKKPPMTQAERLAEAALVEKRNAKSLNRWEEAEKAREEERLAKLAALNNRTLKGPVVTYWSGIGEWENHLKHVGKVAEEEKAPRKKREKKDKGGKAKGKEKDEKESNKEEGLATGAASTLPPSTTTDGQAEAKPAERYPQTSITASHGTVRNHASCEDGGSTPCNGTSPHPTTADSPISTTEARGQTQVDGAAVDTSSSSTGLVADGSSAYTSTQDFAACPGSSGARASGSGAALGSTDSTSRSAETRSTDGSTLPPPPTPAAPAAPEEPPPSEVARNAFILRNFDEELIRDKTVQTQILFGRRMDRLAKPAPRPVCVITAHPARYRDPETGLPYFNAYAYREIQRLRRGEYKWSSLLGAWVGSCTYAARGVPERFLRGGKPKEPEPKTKEVEAEKKEAGTAVVGRAPRAKGRRRTRPHHPHKGCGRTAAHEDGGRDGALPVTVGAADSNADADADTTSAAAAAAC